MHMISKKDLSNAEMDTLTKSCSPTIFITVDGEVQTHEEAIVYVKELDIFLDRPDIDEAKKIEQQTSRNPRGNRATLCLPTQVVQVLKSWSGCKKSERFC